MYSSRMSSSPLTISSLMFLPWCIRVRLLVVLSCSSALLVAPPSPSEITTLTWSIFALDNFYLPRLLVTVVLVAEVVVSIVAITIKLRLNASRMVLTSAPQYVHLTPSTHVSDPVVRSCSATSPIRSISVC
jgi:hypothetical protein